MAVRSKVYVFRPSIAGTAGSNPADVNGCLFVVFAVVCVGSSLCDWLIVHSEESYWLCVLCVCLILCDLETSRVSRSRYELLCCVTVRQKVKISKLNLFGHGYRNVAIP